MFRLGRIVPIMGGSGEGNTAGGPAGAGTAAAYRSLSEFYPFYLSQHANRTCRRLHFVGTTLGLAALLHAIFTLNFWWALAGLATGYLLAWVGHFFFEKNRPALKGWRASSHMRAAKSTSTRPWKASRKRPARDPLSTLPARWRESFLLLRRGEL